MEREGRRQTGRAGRGRWRAEQPRRTRAWKAGGDMAVAMDARNGGVRTSGYVCCVLKTFSAAKFPNKIRQCYIAGQIAEAQESTLRHLK